MLNNFNNYIIPITTTDLLLSQYIISYLFTNITTLTFYFNSTSVYFDQVITNNMAEEFFYFLNGLFKIFKK